MVTQDRYRSESKNPGADKLVVFMPNTRKHHARTHHRRRQHKPNPSTRYKSSYRPRHRHHARNPLHYKQALTNTLWASGGAVGTRALTQIVLQSNNAGAIGYLGNAGIAVGLGLVAEKVNENAGNMVLLGGLVATVLRIAQEKLFAGSAISQQLALQGMGDAEFGLGEFLKSYHVLPSSSNPDGSNDYSGLAPYIGPYLGPYLPQPKPTSPGVSGYDFATGEATVDRFKSRFG